MSEIIVLNEPPVIFTKDRDWGLRVKLKPGAIIQLPDDAILYSPPIDITSPVGMDLEQSIQLETEIYQDKQRTIYEAND